MKSTQRGLTLVGFILVLILVVCAAYLAMRIVPMYTEFASVKSAFNTLAEEPGMAREPTSEVRKRLGRLFNVSYVESVSADDVEHTRSRDGSTLTIEYERRAPIVANLYLVADFKYEVTLQP